MAVAGVREQALRTAVSLTERSSFESLTMRRLADKLKMAPSSLYYYFPSKTALLREMAEMLVGELGMPNPADMDWKSQVRGHARAVLALARKYPRTYPKLASMMNVSKGFQPHWKAMRKVWQRGGFTEETAVIALNGMGRYIFGAVLGEILVAEHPDRLNKQVRTKHIEIGLEALITGFEVRLRDQQVGARTGVRTT